MTIYEISSRYSFILSFLSIIIFCLGPNLISLHPNGLGKSSHGAHKTIG